MLRTQVAPQVLIGDSILDRPNPAEMPQGTLFHESTTGTCSVLVINDATQVRRWEAFCGGTGPTGATA